MTSKIKNRTSGLFTAQGYLSLTYKNVQQCLKILKSWSPVSCVLPPSPHCLHPFPKHMGTSTYICWTLLGQSLTNFSPVKELLCAVTYSWGPGGKQPSQAWCWGPSPLCCCLPPILAGVGKHPESSASLRVSFTTGEDLPALLTLCSCCTHSQWRQNNKTSKQ